MDSSLWITDYRPPLPSTSPSHRIVPSYRRYVCTSASLPLRPSYLVLFLLRPSRRRLHLRERFLSRRQLGNLPHAYAAATLFLSLLPFLFYRYWHPEFCVNNDQINWNYKIPQNRLIDKNPCRLDIGALYVRKICIIRLILKYRMLLHCWVHLYRVQCAK